MKKIKLFILLLIVSIPMFVKADAAAPMSSYKIRISNKSGAEVYEWDDKQEKHVKINKKLPYDEVYQVMYEMIDNKELYAEVYLKNKEETNFYTIKLSDAKPLKITLSDYKKEDSVKYLVFEEKVTLYKGPSKIYGEIEPQISLPINTTLETKYYDDSWAYIEYQGKKGWIYTYSNAQGSPYEEAAGVALLLNDTISLKTIGPVELYETPKSNKKVGVTIPKNTELTNCKILGIYSFQAKDYNYYIEYNGKKGWLRMDIANSNIAVINDFSETFAIVSSKGVKLYNNPNDENSIIDTIPYLDRVESALYTYWKDYRDYRKNHWIQVIYGKKIGWIKEDDVDSTKINFAYPLDDEESDIKFNKSNSLTLYEDLNDLKSEITTIPSDEHIIATLYAYAEEGTWYFTEYNSQEGWVFINDYDDDDDENNENEETNENIENDEEEGNIDNEENSSDDSASDLNIGQKVLDYIIFVAILSLTATVTVILINKKKKERNASK